MTHTLSNKESNTITYLKGIAIFLVIVDHAFSYYSRTVELPIVINTLLTFIQYVHIPLFFVIAGFLCHKQSIGMFYKKKCLRILVPFWLFTVLKLLYGWFISNEFSHAESLGRQLYDAFVLGETYWFAYAICLVYLVAPIFWEKSDKNPPKKAIIGATVLILFNCLYYGMNWHFLKIIFQFRNAVFYLPFFLIGYIIRYYFEPIKIFIHNKNRILLSVAVLVVITVGFLKVREIPTNSYMTKFIASFALIYFLIIVCKALSNNFCLLQNAGKFSWQLMLLDAFYKAILFAILPKIIGINISLPILVAVLDLLLGLGTCYIAKKIPLINKLMGF